MPKEHRLTLGNFSFNVYIKFLILIVARNVSILLIVAFGVNNGCYDADSRSIKGTSIQ